MNQFFTNVFEAGNPPRLAASFFGRYSFGAAVARPFMQFFEPLVQKV